MWWKLDLVTGPQAMYYFISVFIKNGITALTDNPRNGLVGHKNAKHQASVFLTGHQEVECNGQSATRVDGFVVPGVKLVNPGAHSSSNFLKHRRAIRTKL